MTHEDDFLADSVLGEHDIESTFMPAPRQIAIQARREYRRIAARQNLRDIVPHPPASGVSLHIIGTGLYDFWTFVPQILDWITTADELYCSTWTLNRPNAIELFKLWDEGRIAPCRVSYLTGEYFKRRETAVYAYLYEGIQTRGGRFRAFMNHAKVLLVSNAASDTYLTCEGSANLTANPRLEQYVFTNDRTLYEFHRTWMEECLTQ